MIEFDVEISKDIGLESCKGNTTKELSTASGIKGINRNVSYVTQSKGNSDRINSDLSYSYETN